MPKVTLTFELPEEQEEFSVAEAGGRSISAIHDIRNEIFRPARKHGYTNPEIQRLVERLDKLAEGTDVGGATELIWELEQLFNAILIEYNIPGDI
jgi:hypothetical protein